jgi:hypothetical protein
VKDAREKEYLFKEFMQILSNIANIGKN